MEAERRHVAGIDDGLPVFPYAKGMRRIINNLQAVSVGYLLYPLRLAGLAVDMHGHDGSGLGSDCRLYLLGVDIPRLRVDVDKHRLDAVPPQGMRGSHKTIRSGYHLPRDVHGLKRTNQWQRAVGKQADVRHP